MKMKLLYDCPMYNLKAEYKIEMKYEPTSENLLRYGKILTDDEFSENNSDKALYDNISSDWCNTRIRIIAYNNHIYYHKMVDGETNEVKQLD